MGLLSRLFGKEDFSGQISDQGVKSMLANLSFVETDVFQFLEPTHHIGLEDQMFIPNLLGEFRDPKVGIVHGQGDGHAFIRTKELKSIDRDYNGEITDYKTLVWLFRDRGLEVKRIKYICVEGG